MASGGHSKALETLFAGKYGPSFRTGMETAKSPFRGRPRPGARGAGRDLRAL